MLKAWAEPNRWEKSGLCSSTFLSGIYYVFYKATKWDYSHYAPLLC